MTPGQLLDAMKREADRYVAGEACFEFGDADVHPADIYDLCEYVKHLEARTPGKNLDYMRNWLVRDRYREL